MHFVNILHKDGVMTHQWPKIYIEYLSLYKNNFIKDDILEIYLLRARWFIIDKEYRNIKKIVLKEILGNDEKNNRINNFLEKFNKSLSSINFPIFEKNDIRGIDLSGCVLSNLSSAINLSHLDLSYSELAYLSCNNVNISYSNLTGARGCFMSIRNSLLLNVKLDYSILSNSKFHQSSIRGYSITCSLLCSCLFEDTDCSFVDFSSSRLLESSFKTKESHVNQLLEKIKFNKNTDVRHVYIDRFLAQQNKKIGIFVDTSNSKLFDAIDIKFSLSIFNINVKNILLQIWFKFIKRK